MWVAIIAFVLNGQAFILSTDFPDQSSCQKYLEDSKASVRGPVDKDQLKVLARCVKEVRT